MNIVKIFLASSAEVKHERVLFADVLWNFDEARDDIKFNLVKWEYLDASMGPKHKQDEYNDELKTCDIVFVVFWRRFGEYTDEELQMALNGHKINGFPRLIVVMFKSDGQPINEDLLFFKESLKPEPGIHIHEFSTDEEYGSIIRSELLSYIESSEAGKNS